MPAKTTAVDIAVGYGDGFRKFAIDGEVFGMWAVTRAVVESRGYAITHLYSGAAVGYAKNKKEARRIARNLDVEIPEAGVWQSADPYDIAARIERGEDEAAVAAVMRIVRADAVNPRLLR